MMTLISHGVNLHHAISFNHMTFLLARYTCSGGKKMVDLTEAIGGNVIEKDSIENVCDGTNWSINGKVKHFVCKGRQRKKKKIIAFLL